MLWRLVLTIALGAPLFAKYPLTERDDPVARVKSLKSRRDGTPTTHDRHRQALKNLEEVARAGGNVMPALIEASEALATVGEMMDTLKKVYGQFDGAPEW
jgi:methylmalonyl-CoA mutase N-terminal domain/subunit